MSDPALVILAIAQALGLRQTEDRGQGWPRSGEAQPLQQVQAYLRNKHLLLLLDDFEQLISAALQLADLLVCCPRLHRLVTSRAALRISSEYEFAVPPLAVPDLTQLRSAAHENEEMKLVLRLSSGLLVFWTWAQTPEK